MIFDCPACRSTLEVETDGELVRTAILKDATERKERTEQITLEGKPIEGVLDATSGLFGMQDEIKTIASINLDASPFRKVTVRGSFCFLPFRDGAFRCVLFDPPHTIDTRNTLFGTLDPMKGLGPHLATFKYGSYPNMKQLREDVGAGAAECGRVLEIGGEMIFKWSNSEKPFSWAIDTVSKVAPDLEKTREKIIRSGAHAKNMTMYVWFKKRVNGTVPSGPGAASNGSIVVAETEPLLRSEFGTISRETVPIVRKKKVARTKVQAKPRVASTHS